jgi:hypothetical protein
METEFPAGSAARAAEAHRMVEEAAGFSHPCCLFIAPPRNGAAQLFLSAGSHEGDGSSIEAPPLWLPTAAAPQQTRRQCSGSVRYFFQVRILILIFMDPDLAHLPATVNKNRFFQTPHGTYGKIALRQINATGDQMEKHT